MREEKKVKKDLIVTLLLLTALLGCTRLVRIDVDTYLNNQASYQGKHILIKAELNEILEQYEVFKNVSVEVTAPVIYFEEKDSPAWFLILEKDGKRIRGYEDRYKHFIPPDAVYLARWAKREGGEITAMGRVKERGIELDQLTYKGLIVNTNAPPS